jgi:hypothetical protein
MADSDSEESEYGEGGQEYFPPPPKVVPKGRSRALNELIELNVVQKQFLCAIVWELGILVFIGAVIGISMFGLFLQGLR